MGVLSSLFGSNNDDKKNKEEAASLPWKAIDSEAMLNEMLEVSNQKLVVLFKHSTRCGISRMVLNRFEAEADFDPDKVALYFLDLLRYRDISNKISEKFGVMHQSPQVIVLENGNVIGDASHQGIDAKSIAEHLAN